MSERSLKRFRVGTTDEDGFLRSLAATVVTSTASFDVCCHTADWLTRRLRRLA